MASPMTPRPSRRCRAALLTVELVLVPSVLAARGSSVLTTSIVLTALPAGFAPAATGGDRLLPRSMTDRSRCLLGAGVFTVAWLVPVLALCGLGLGTFTSANNTMSMSAIRARSSGTGGGLVNMARGLGTSWGVALVTLALHLGGRTGGGREAALVLLVVALLALGAAWASPAGNGARARHADL
ncbi:hypothetical protein [Streptomyces sp. NPDC048385]|uniref:hypothetical protein n=1 Tax=unclassified Streptomyces TaxID=2593676 RepID=UPI00341D0607